MERYRGPTLLVMLAATTLLSQFYRASTGVIAPELMGDLAMPPEALGLANGGFFLALLAMQIPVGLLFDRFGPRRVVTLLLALVMVAALLHGVIESGRDLLVARILLGIGNAASFMAAVLLISRWYAGEGFTSRLSWVFAASNLGMLLAATPLAWASALVGWRWCFVGAGLLTATLAALFWLLVRDQPAGQVVARPTETVGEVLRGLVAVWRSPGLARVLAMHAFAYASMLTVFGLWAGPYLNDVHGLDGVARGNVLLAMGLAQITGILIYGPLDRRFNSRKRVVVAGSLLTLACLALLALIVGSPFWLAVTLLVLLCLVTAYGIVIVAHGRGLFPDHLAGRGVTTVNLAQALGCAALPIVTGWIVGAFPVGPAGSPEVAYRAAFGAIGLCLAAGLVAYGGARDSRPRGG
jgi:predicted MFS family arabinose efflux permease